MGMLQVEIALDGQRGMDDFSHWNLEANLSSDIANIVVVGLIGVDRRQRERVSAPNGEPPDLLVDGLFQIGNLIRPWVALIQKTPLH